MLVYQCLPQGKGFAVIMSDLLKTYLKIGVGRCPQTGYKVLISEPGWKPRGLGPSGQKLKPRALSLVKNKAAQQKGPENLRHKVNKGLDINPREKMKS